MILYGSENHWMVMYQCSHLGHHGIIVKSIWYKTTVGHTLCSFSDIEKIVLRKNHIVELM